MAEEIAFENGRNSNFEGLVTLTLGRVILHTVVHHSSTSTYMPNFIEVEETFCGRTYVRTRTDGRTDGRTFATGFIRSTLSKSRPKIQFLYSAVKTEDAEARNNACSILDCV